MFFLLLLSPLQATSPFVMPTHFQKALELMTTTGADSLVTAVRTHRFLWKVDPLNGEASAINYEPSRRPRRQDWDGELVENGAFYMSAKALLERSKCRLGGRVALLEMEEYTFVELDSLVDWQIVSNMASKYGFTKETSANILCDLPEQFAHHMCNVM